MMKRILFIVLLPLVLLSCQSIATLDNGAKIYADSYFYIGAIKATDGITRDHASFTLAEDFTFPNGMVLKKDTRCTINMGGGGRLIRYVLAQDWKDPDKGCILKAGFEIEHYEYGNRMHSFVLAADWLDHQSGRIFKGGKTLKFTREGAAYQFVLAQDWQDPDPAWNFVYKAGVIQRPPVKEKTHVVPEIVLAKDWRDPGWNIVFAADSRVTFSDSGKIGGFSPAHDVPVPNSTMVIKKGTLVKLYEKGYFSSLTLAQDFTAPAGYVLKAGTVVEFNEKGGVKKATFAKPWRDPATGVNYQADKEYSF